MKLSLLERIRVAAVIGSAASMSVAVGGVVVVADATEARADTWRTLPKPALWPNSRFNAVSASGAGDVWGVGSQFNQCVPVWDSKVCSENPALTRWNGSSWKNYNPPSFTGNGSLSQVSGTTADNVWIAGTRSDDTNYVARWNGSTWSQVTMPLAETHKLSLSAGADGTWVANGDRQVAHWDGTAWTTSQATDGVSQIVGLTADDAWAVTGHWAGLPGWVSGVDHWDGTSWTTVNVPKENGTFYRVLPIAADNVWFSGYLPMSPGRYAEGTLHWNGTTATVVPLPSDVTGIGPIIADGQGTAWALGRKANNSTYASAVLRFDGAQWQQVQTPALPGEGDYRGYLDLAKVPGTGSILVVGTDGKAPITITNG